MYRARHPPSKGIGLIVLFYHSDKNGWRDIVGFDSAIFRINNSPIISGRTDLVRRAHSSLYSYFAALAVQRAPCALRLAFGFVSATF